MRSVVTHVNRLTFGPNTHNNYTIMDPKKAADMANRMKKMGKGGGIGVGVLAAAGAAVYGLTQSFYTGEIEKRQNWKLEGQLAS